MTTTQDIAAPIEVAWQVLTDLASYGEWNPYLVEMKGDAAVGGTIEVTAHPIGRDPLSYPIDVVEVVAPTTLRVQGGLPDRSQFLGDHWFELEAINDTTTRLTHWEEFSGSLGEAIFGDEGPKEDFERMNAALAKRAEELAAR